MAFRCSFFFVQQVGNKTAGYSENYWNNLTDISSVIAALTALRSALIKFKGFGISCPVVRVQDLSNFRAAQQVNFVTSGTPPSGGNFGSDFPTTKGLLRLFGPTKYTVNQWLGSIPDGAVSFNGQWTPQPSTVTSFKALVALLTNGANGWVTYQQDKTQAKKTITAVTLAGVVTVTAHGYASGNKVRISRTGGIPGLNAVWTITVIDSNTFQLVAVPVGGFTGGYTKVGTAQLQSRIFQNITDAQIIRVTEHKVGRPFGLFSGAALPGQLAGWSACGCVMDYLRSCYSSHMRLYPDRPDVLVPGQWYFCPPGAIHLPFFVACASREWDFYDAPEVTGVGEADVIARWLRGDCPPQFQGKHFCGTVDAWLHGISFADAPGLPLGSDSVPLCCQAQPYTVTVAGTACGCGGVYGI